MNNKVFILQMSFDCGIHAQWCFYADTEMDVWKYVLNHKKDYALLFEDTVAIGKFNSQGYSKRLEEINNLTPELLKEICDESYIDGDSCPGVELDQVEVCNIKAITNK